MDPVFEDWVRLETRRQFLRRGGNALGWAALAALGLKDGLPQAAAAESGAQPGEPRSRPTASTTLSSRTVSRHVASSPSVATTRGPWSRRSPSPTHPTNAPSPAGDRYIP